MDVVRLGEFNNVNPTYLPDMVIDRYSSMIWTERFLSPGEFQMKTPYVEETLEAIPEKTLISLRDSQEVMRVETLSIETDENGQEELTVAGRTVDAILETRFLESQYQKKRKMAQNYTESDAALVLLWNAINNDTGVDVTRDRQDDDNDDDDDDDDFHDGDVWPWNTKDILPNVSVTDATPSIEIIDTKRFWITEGLMYPQFIKILDKGDLGIRTLRPPNFVGIHGRRKIHVGSGTAHLGEVFTDTFASSGDLLFEIFKGTDLSGSVIFNVNQDQIEKPSYLWSIKDYRTAIEIMSSLNRKQDYYRPDEAGFTGWNRFVTALDAGSPELPTKPTYPGKNASDAAQTKYETRLARWQDQRTTIYNQFENDYEQDARRELKKTRKISLFSGDASPNAPYVFKQDYNLGDTVALRGQRGFSSTAIVSEYVRTEDAEGDRGYPGFEIV
jgi:hypothetical protein